MSPRRTASELVFFSLCAAAAVPLFAVRWPPIQDLPQHLAAVRILADYDDPSLRFAEHYVIELSRTQYLAYYVAARALAAALGTLLANKVLVALALVATPYAMRALLRALGRDERLALFTLPLLWNAHLLLGFLNFIAAIPLALFGLALAVGLRREFTLGRAVGLAAIALVTFYTHVVPFGLLAIGAALLSVGEGARETARRLVALAPAGVAKLFWLFGSPAGRATSSAARLGDSAPGAPEPHFSSVAENLAAAPGWITDVLRSPLDDAVIVAWVLLALACLALGSYEARPDGPNLRARAGVLAPLSLALYFGLPTSYDWIWPINARFALLAPLFSIVLIPSPRGLAGWVVYGLLASLSLGSSVEITRAFSRFEAEEVADFDEALEAIPEGARVAGLVFDRGSDHVRFSPFLHSAAMVQAERGGAVMFSFVDFPQSPILFREDARPPRVPPRWEWKPAEVDPARELGFYDYVIVRGGPGRIARQRERFRPVYRGERWSVYAARPAGR